MSVRDGNVRQGRRRPTGCRREPGAGIPAEQMDFVRQILDRVGVRSMLVAPYWRPVSCAAAILQREIPGISRDQGRDERRAHAATAP
ncbi:hypothetical protein [Streptomyces mirabilis]|uniref:hypothetical protein n=1 Tax=Streptomyces mirabilis TaxID=68239 RepID=UPI0036A80665